MKTLIRRVRGACGMAATWTLLWSALGSIAYALQRTESGAFPSFTAFLWNAIGWAVTGAIGGLVFGVCLATDARSHLSQLSIRRGGTWGALSALAFPLAFEVGGRLLMHRPLSWFHARMLGEFAVVGLICGATLIAIAQRSARRDTRVSSTDSEMLELGIGAFVPASENSSARSAVR